VAAAAPWSAAERKLTKSNSCQMLIGGKIETTSSESSIDSSLSSRLLLHHLSKASYCKHRSDRRCDSEENRGTSMGTSNSAMFTPTKPKPKPEPVEISIDLERILPPAEGAVLVKAVAAAI